MPSTSSQPTSSLDSLLALEAWEHVLDDIDCTELAARVTSLSAPRYDAHFGVCRCGPCPFDPDHGDAFEVNATGYFCQGCGDGGTTVEFWARRERCTSAEAHRWLTRLLDEGTLQQRRLEQRALWRVLEEACWFWQQVLCTLPAGEPGRQWIAAQGITEKTIAQFGLGFVPDRAEQDQQLMDFLLAKGLSIRALEESGLCTMGGDSYAFTIPARKNAITIPVRDARGNCWGYITQPVVGDFSNLEPAALTAMRRLSHYRYNRLVYPVPTWPQDFQRHPFVLLTPSVWETVLLHQAGIESAVHVGDMSLRHPGRIQRTIAAMASKIIFPCAAEHAGGDLFHERLADLGALMDRTHILVLPRGKGLIELLATDGPASFRDRLTSTVTLREFLG